LALDTESRLYVADCFNLLIRVIDISQIRTLRHNSRKSNNVVNGTSADNVKSPISTLVRVWTLSGHLGKKSSQNGNFEEAGWSNPTGIMLTPAGDILVADLGNSQKVRKISGLKAYPCFNTLTRSIKMIWRFGRLILTSNSSRKWTDRTRSVFNAFMFVLSQPKLNPQKLGQLLEIAGTKKTLRDNEGKKLLLEMLINRK